MPDERPSTDLLKDAMPVVDRAVDPQPVQARTIEHTFSVVGGRYPFPIDMLRHDRCTPLGPEDAAKIFTSIYGDVREVEIELLCHDSFLRSPVVDRWKSFGWTVKED